MRERRPSLGALRVGAAAFVATLALATRALEPDPGARRAALLGVALGLGYGHQLGAWWFARRHGRRSPLARAARGLTLLTASLAFALALASPAAPWLLVALAALAVWHVVENDLSLSRDARAGLQLPPLARSAGPHLASLLASAAAVALVFAAPGLAPVLVAWGVPPVLAAWTPEEGIAVLLLYHVAVWGGRSLGAPSLGPAAGGRAGRVLAAHLLPLGLLLAASGLAPGVYAWLASPSLYLFLSALHAVHTSLERGFAAA